MNDKENELNEFLVSCFYSILSAEEKSLGTITNGKLSIKEIHLIDAVYRTRENGKSNFSNVANALGVTLGTLTAAFTKLENKGYLIKERDKTDKRIFYIVPTRLAEVINEEHSKWHKELVKNVIKTLPEDQSDNLVVALKQLSLFINKIYLN